MLRTIFPVAFLLTFPLAAADIVPHVETRDFSGGTVQIHVRAGVRIVHGADNQHITVRYTAMKDGLDASGRVKLDFAAQGTAASINLLAPRGTRVDTVIEVPDPVSLDVRIEDGELLIQGVEGNKTLQARSGNITVTAPRSAYAQAYKQIDVSAKIGSVYGAQFQSVHSRFAKLGHSGELKGRGAYTLHAYVRFGDIQLLPEL